MIVKIEREVLPSPPIKRVVIEFTPAEAALLQEMTYHNFDVPDVVYPDREDMRQVLSLFLTRLKDQLCG